VQCNNISRNRKRLKVVSTTTTVARIDAVQAEYSAFETLHESDGLVSTARELGIAYVAYGPLGRGWLVDDCPYQTPDDFELNDYRRQSIYT
jgi:aryl-alcohol dehydrogenase-like predicted oxidoreductase